MTFVFFVDLLFLDRHIPPLCGIVGGIENQPQPHERREFIMTKKRKIGLVIGAAAACIAVLCAAGACNGTAKEERIAYRVIVTTTMTAVTSQPTEISTTATPTMTAPVTTTVETTTEPQITTTVTCSATETTTATTEQTIAIDTTVPPTTTPATTTAPAPAEPYNGQTSGDYIYCIGFGWIFNEGGGGYGETNYEMYCNGNKIGYFG